MLPKCFWFLGLRHPLRSFPGGERGSTDCSLATLYMPRPGDFFPVTLSVASSLIAAIMGDDPIMLMFAHHWAYVSQYLKNFLSEHSSRLLRASASGEESLILPA